MASCAGHIDVIDMFGREQVAARLELLVVRRGSETEALVVRLSSSEKARGASLVPVPGLRHCTQCFDSS
eukprot:9488001-Pyramimonas_sp.AAC.1